MQYGYNRQKSDSCSDEVKQSTNFHHVTGKGETYKTFDLFI